MSVLKLKILTFLPKNRSRNSYYFFNLSIELEAVAMNYLASQWEVFTHFRKRTNHTKDD